MNDKKLKEFCEHYVSLRKSPDGKVYNMAWPKGATAEIMFRDLKSGRVSNMVWTNKHE